MIKSILHTISYIVSIYIREMLTSASEALVKDFK